MRRWAWVVGLALTLPGGLRAGEPDIIRRLEKAGGSVSRREWDGEKDCLDVHLSRTRNADAALAELCELRRLRMLRLDGSDVTDAGMRTVGGLAGLRGLELRGTAVTDAGLKA